MAIKRRTFIKRLAVLAAAVGIPYSLWRGIRYPFLSLESPLLSKSFSNDGLSLELQDCFNCKNPEWFDQYAEFPEAVFLRAYAPEPQIKIARSNKEQTIVLNNIFPDAEISNSLGLAKESINGITRVITIPALEKELTLSWKVPFGEDYKFAAIGDTGGAKELEWCLTRSKQLGAKFFIHLGDFNYQESDYETAVKYFINAPLPCYVTIGNHDFHDSGLIVDKFLDNIGPLNNAFVINTVRYVNLDTAATFFPVSGGKRGDFFKLLAADDRQYDDTVLFTHRPFQDPRPEYHQDFGNQSERDWLVSTLKKARIDTVLTGHIHHFFDFTVDDIRLIISGQGLAHKDLIVQKNEGQILIGNVKSGQKIDYQTADINMPFDMHCHPYVSDWRKANDTPFAKKVNELCEPEDAKNK